MPSSNVAAVNRQKLASVPPMSLAERWPQTTDIENRIVVRNAGNTAQTLSESICSVESLSGCACFHFHGVHDYRKTRPKWNRLKQRMPGVFVAPGHRESKAK